MKTPLITRLAAACAGMGTTFVLLWAVLSIADPSAEATAPVAQARVAGAIVVAAAAR